MHSYAQKAPLHKYTQLLMNDNDTDRKKVIGGENIWSNLCPLSND